MTLTVRLSNWVCSMALLSYLIASGIPVALTIVKCWNIYHQNHKHTYSHEPHDQNDKSNMCHTLYDWYFSIWHASMSLEFHWQLSNWVGPLFIIRMQNKFGKRTILVWWMHFRPQLSNRQSSQQSAIIKLSSDFIKYCVFETTYHCHV